SGSSNSLGDRDAGSAAGCAVVRVTRRDDLDPERILVLEVRGVASLAQFIQTVLLRTRGCGGESRQLEDYPGAFLHLIHGESHGWPFSGHLDFGASANGAVRYCVILAIAAQNDWRLSRGGSAATETAFGCAWTTRTTFGRARTAKSTSNHGSTR